MVPDFWVYLVESLAARLRANRNHRLAGTFQAY
jgi:hypothetical protein